jgi:hypothetical protein
MHGSENVKIAVKYGLCETGSCVSIVTRLRTESPKKCCSIHGEAKICLFSITSRLSTFSTQPRSNPIKCP